MGGGTGQIRRDSCPFMWLCTIVVCDRNPEDDAILQICLLANRVNTLLSGINMPYEETICTPNKIDQIQPLCLKLGQSVALAFNINVTTKLHRMMRHVKDQMDDFGSLI